MKNKTYPKALKLLSNKRIIIDSAFLQKIEDAENGDLSECFSLINIFSVGQDGFKKDYEIAIYYLNKLKKAHSNISNKASIFTILYQEALIEDNFKNYKKALKKYEKALKYMVLKLPCKEWDYGFLKTMSGIKDLCKE